MSWADGPMLAFDTETTGVDPETARIVTACATRIYGSAVETRTWLADPGIDIPAEASAVHGISTEHAREHGALPAVVVAEIWEHLTEWWARGYPVVIMNSAYDLTVLDRELRRHCNSQLGAPGPVIDPMVIDRAMDKWRKGKRTLSDLCKTYRVALVGAHTAEGDCIAAARVAWRLAKAYPDEVGDVGLNALQLAQHDWRYWWAEEFRDYLAKRGKPADDVHGDWPLREVA